MFENITLEMSLKPFKQTDTEYIRSVARGIFEQWHSLLRGRKCISVMLWIGDGSELLDYAGREEAVFEWCRYLGTANLPLLGVDEPQETSLHKRKQMYMENPPEMTYGILKNIVRVIKEEMRSAFPTSKTRVGTTFDIGPEFAVSDFKYNRHPEICTGTKLGAFGFVDATSELRGDSRHYAAYPDGIPDGTQFGAFLGKQAQIFANDMGFDYLWLSNGLGFSSNPWDKTGKIFDGQSYRHEKLAQTKNRVMSFWKSFREACPGLPVETRGTNNSAGIDYATDGVPLHELYSANLGITAPPNSPWAAINDNFGLEIMGHMTRVCELPSERFPFRYYLHDPWWVNSPWYDRYDGAPCDIYLPMSISRITADGQVESANSLNILSIDNSFGNMPDACVNEPMPHILKAEKDIPDAPAPLVWVYPMREYTTADSAEALREMNLCDNYVSDAINSGLPLCCVSSTDAFLQHAPELYRNSIIITPVPQNEEILSRLYDFSEQGINIIVYGTERMLDRLAEKHGILKIDIANGPEEIREALAELGYLIDFIKKGGNPKPPTLALIRRNGGLVLSAYNPNTTTEISLAFPDGAPILCGMEARISDNKSVYTFTRSEHRECRVFVKQNDGVISCREAPPVNTRFRRAIRIRGLDDAGVILHSEADCECAVSIAPLTDDTPIYDKRFAQINDGKGKIRLVGEHVSGDIYFLIGHRGTAKI